MADKQLILTDPMKQRLFFGFTENDYEQMFDLHNSEKNMHILDMFGSANGFTASLVEKEYSIDCCDSLPEFNTDSNNQWFKELCQLTSEYFIANANNFHIDENIAQWLEQRIDIAKNSLFLQTKLQRTNWHKINNLKNLPFADNSFDLALSPYWWFIYDHLITIDEHLQGIAELIRVAAEIRIFPITNYKGESSSLLGPTLLAMQNKGFNTEIKDVDFNLQESNNVMLRIWKNNCQI